MFGVNGFRFKIFCYCSKQFDLECTDVINDSYSCEFLKKHGACIQNKDRMKNMCPATCGYCSKFHIEK